MRLLCASLFILAGCATSTEIRGPNGQIAHLIECPGAALTMGTCYEKANDLCPSGYNVLDAQQELGATMVSPYGAVQNVDRHLVIQCAP